MEFSLEDTSESTENFPNHNEREDTDSKDENFKTHPVTSETVLDSSQNGP